MITIEQFGKKDLVIFGRHPDGKRYVKKIRDFQPYFYDDQKNKIVVDTPSQVPEMRKVYTETYEADIVYPQRYLIDRCSIPLPKEPLRICYLDIEVANACLDTDTALLATASAFNATSLSILLHDILATLKENVKSIVVDVSGVTLSFAKPEPVPIFTYIKVSPSLSVYLPYVLPVEPNANILGTVLTTTSSSSNNSN